MKIEIHEHGGLAIDDRFKMCPYAPVGVRSENSSRDIGCGDWCALFGPIENGNEFDADGNIVPFKTVSVCMREWSCSPKDFTDKRSIEP